MKFEMVDVGWTMMKEAEYRESIALMLCIWKIRIRSLDSRLVVEGRGKEVKIPSNLYLLSEPTRRE